MKLKSFLVCLALLAPGTILAQTATAISGAGAASQSAAGAVSGAGAAAVMENSFNTPAHTTSKITSHNTQDTHYSGTNTVKMAPNIIAPNILPSVPCASVTSAGLSVLGGGLTFGTAHQDEDCNLRETARMMHTIGRVEDALDVLCASQHAKAARTCKERVKTAELEAARERIAAEEHEQRLKRMREEAVRDMNDGRRTENQRGMPTRDGFIKPIMLEGENAKSVAEQITEKQMTPLEKEIWNLKPTTDK